MQSPEQTVSKSLFCPSKTSSSNFLALGDSYTIGEAVVEAESWPARLCELLEQQSASSWHLHVIAKTGWSTDELDQAITEALAEIEQSYDLVSLLIGVNNQYRGRSVSEYALQFDALLQRALGLANDDPQCVLVLSIPDWGHTPFATKDPRSISQISQEIDDFNRTAAAICQANDIRFVDITSHSRSGRSGLLASDELHPSALAYSEWARLAFDAMQKPAP
jgi:lysophospholipase L1-like esterase